MFQIFLYVSVTTCISIILISLLMVAYKSSLDKEKTSPFESGFEPTGSTRIMFCMKFFLVGVLFLIFDVEVSLLLPLPYSQTFVLFLLIILVWGLLYEWYYGSLEWLYVNGCSVWSGWCVI